MSADEHPDREDVMDATDEDWIVYVHPDELAAVERERDEERKVANSLSADLTRIARERDDLNDAHVEACRELAEARADAQDRERERDEARAALEPKQVCIDALTEVIEKSSEVYVERDALRARVEELEAGLRDLLADIEGYGSPCIHHDVFERVRDALLSGSREEPRPKVSEKLKNLTGDDTTEVADFLTEYEEPRPDTGETPCPHCGGGGYREQYGIRCFCRPDTGETCPACEGSGRVEYECDPVEPRWRDCPYCGGSGRRPDTTKEDHDA